MARPKGDIDARIVRAARVVFLRDGVDGASLRDIARRAKTSVGMVHYYFESKDNLFLAVIEAVYVKLLEDLTATLSTAATTEERLRALFARVAAASEDEVDVLRLVVREALVSSARRARVLERASRGHIPILLGALAQGVDAGELAPRPLALLMMATLAVGVVPQVVRRLASDAPPIAALPEGEALASLLADVLFDGVRAQAAEGERRAARR